MIATLGAVAFMPASAFAATADSFEPDGSFGTARPLTVDAAAQQHTIYPAGDEDWVSFPVSAGLTYVIETAEGTPAESMDTVLSLYDSNGTTLIDSNDDYGGLYSRIDYVADANKTVYAKIVGFGGATGAYALSVTLAPLVGDAYEPDGSHLLATPIAVGDAPQQHTIDPEYDEDWASFPVSAGRTYAIETAEGSPADSMDTYLWLMDSNGITLLEGNNDHDGSLYSRIDYTADADETLYALVEGYDGSTGAYALSVTLVGDAYEPDGSAGAATAISVGEAAQQHTIDPYRDEDWVALTVEAGQKYAIQTAPGASPANPYTLLSLYDSDGTTELGSGEADGTWTRIVYAADVDKTVFVRITGYDTGAYALAVSLFGDSYEADDSATWAKPIAVGGVPQQHTMDPMYDEDWVSFSVEAGRRYAVETSAGTPEDDPYTDLFMYDADGTTEIGYNDWPPSYSRIVYTADRDKTVYVMVTSRNTGTYALSVTLRGDSYEPDGTSAWATPIAVGDPPQQHTIDFMDDEDWVAFAVESGWRYAIQTAPGTVPQDPDTELYLYDSSGLILIDSNDDYSGHYSRLVYEADADQVLYAMVQGESTGTYALSLSRTPILKIGVVPESVDFGEVAVGASLQRTIVVQNLGVAPLAVGDVQVSGAGFSIVRDEAGGTAIPVGGSREIEVAYAPTVACTGPPAAVKHDWTTLRVQWLYSGAVHYGYWLYSGFQNTGGAGALGWRVKIGAQETTGSGAVVAGGCYIVRLTVNKGSSSGLVELLEPVSDAFEFINSLGGLQSVAYLRVPDATLSIASNDDDEPEVNVGLFGVAVPPGPDSTPPTTSDDADGQWHRSAVTVHLTPVDAGGSGMSGGLAKTEYSKDGGATWSTGTSVTYDIWKRGGGSGVHTLLYRSTDAAGNVEEARSVQVLMDARAPVTTDDVPSTPQPGGLTVHLTAADTLFGVTACSGVASVTYSLDGGAPQTVPGASASVPVSGAGTHWIAYASTDNAGNTEYVKWRSVTIVAAGKAARGLSR